MPLTACRFPLSGASSTPVVFVERQGLAIVSALDGSVRALKLIPQSNAPSAVAGGKSEGPNTTLVTHDQQTEPLGSRTYMSRHWDSRQSWGLRLILPMW